MNEPDEQPVPRNEMSGSAYNVVQAGTVHGGIHVYGSTTPSRPTDSGDAFTAVVDALLEVPSVRDEPSRRLLLSRMRREIAEAVPHHERARLHVIELVRTCQNYDGGLDDLLRVLRELEGTSTPVRRSEEAVRALMDDKPEFDCGP
ncbi:hypothetical protein C8D88_110107 [Lentzea atacamensis]|uniref:Effector-associated domain-containing protein n=1 Tax=Lentzea atacamensis TaxID=531938 RepID=A0A316HQT1_9PSEU|nr:hypothetical protein [Lentzea atacamensis]PWK83651.1 hypothetical protein C8D88_110107 [Lentzea atacamensis]